jgi:peptide-methionine (S)-S-oxide reductase
MCVSICSCNGDTTRVRDRTSRKTRGGVARAGDVVTLDLHLLPENGFVPEPVFDSMGTVSFVLQGGNYLPGLHELVEGCSVGDTMEGVSIDAGWGERRDDLLITVPTKRLENVVKDPHQLVTGTTLKLKGDIEVVVAAINTTDTTVVLDANPPLAGTSYACGFTVLAIDPLPTSILQLSQTPSNGGQTATSCCISIDDRYQAATFALGCFWGAELAFMRVPGVVGTKVGYSQGVTLNPTYEQVCSGRTQHREAVQVIFDSKQVSYEELVKVALARLQSVQTPPDLHRLFQEGDDDDETKQYRHGFYYHSEAQMEIAEQYISENNNRFGIELLQAATFWEAEEWHQQYLYKGGQSGRKGAKETIRCYG